MEHNEDHLAIRLAQLERAIRRTRALLGRWIGVLAYAPYRDRPGYAFDKDGFLWPGSPKEYSFLKVSLYAPFDTVLTTSRAYVARPLNENERAKLQPLRSRLVREFGESVADARLPRTALAFAQLTVDDVGRLWVAQYPRRQADGWR